MGILHITDHSIEPVEAVYRSKKLRFVMRIGQLRVLEERFDIGAASIASSLSDGSFRHEYIMEIVRLGLAGADYSADDIDHIMGMFFARDSAAHNCLLLAQSILLNALVGTPPKKKDGLPPSDPTNAQKEMAGSV